MGLSKWTNHRGAEIVADTFRVRSGQPWEGGAGPEEGEAESGAVEGNVEGVPSPSRSLRTSPRPPRTSPSPQCRSPAPATCAASAAWGDPARWWRGAATLPKRRSG